MQLCRLRHGERVDKGVDGKEGEAAEGRTGRECGRSRRRGGSDLGSVKVRPLWYLNKHILLGKYVLRANMTQC